MEGVDKYVNLRVDDHSNSVNELIRLSNIWELTILKCEDPNDVCDLKEVAGSLQEVLKKLGYYQGPATGHLDQATVKALKEWMAMNNFETE